VVRIITICPLRPLDRVRRHREILSRTPSCGSGLTLTAKTTLNRQNVSAGANAKGVEELL
jgi:hypothetical protein